MLNKIITYLFFNFLIVAFANAQQQNLPLNREFNLTNQKAFNSINNNTHTAFQPIIQSFIQKDSLTSLSHTEKDYFLINISKSAKKPSNFYKWLYQSAFYDNFAIIDTGNFYLTIDPLLNLEIGSVTENEEKSSIYKNTRGIIVRGNISKQFSFETNFYENQAVYPNYITNFIQETGVAPGQGRVKKFKENGFDFASSSANISYTPASFINFQMGTGKNFIGDGYRSILLSDQAFNYPFFKITTLFGKKDQFQYIQLNAQLTNLIRRDAGSTSEALFQRKAMSTHYFNWIATKWLTLGIFENTIWRTEDSSGTKPFQIQQLNPIIGINALTTIADRVNHSNIGINTKIKLPFKLVMYNQFIYDGNQYEKTSGYQIGFKYFGINNLSLQVEYNKLDNPYNTTFEPELQQFYHYNESLTHPSGNSFEEIVGIINYKYKRIFTQFKINYNNINSTTKLRTIQTHLGYLINSKNNMSFLVGLNNRKEIINKNNPLLTNYIYIGFRTSLRNLYSDF